MRRKLTALDAFVAAIGFDVGPYNDLRVFEYMNESELKAFADAGFDVQLHTHNHTMGDFSPEFVWRELETNAAALSKITGRPRSSFEHFCYPSGVSNRAIADRLQRDGIKSATTTVTDLAQPETHICLLPRIIDGDNMSQIELEAELAGLASQLRQVAT